MSCAFCGDMDKEIHDKELNICYDCWIEKIYPKNVDNDKPK